jgi:hypothetical protein
MKGEAAAAVRDLAVPLVVRFVGEELSPPPTAVGGPSVGTRTDVGLSTVGEGAALGGEKPVGVMDGTSDGASLSSGMMPPGAGGAASKVGSALGAASTAAGAVDGAMAALGADAVGAPPGPAEGGSGMAAVGADGAAGASLDAGDEDAEGGKKTESSSVALGDGAGVPGEGRDGTTCDGGLRNSRLFSSTVLESATAASSSSSQYVPGVRDDDMEQSHLHSPPSSARAQKPPL